MEGVYSTGGGVGWGGVGWGGGGCGGVMQGEFTVARAKTFLNRGGPPPLPKLSPHKEGESEKKKEKGRAACAASEHRRMQRKGDPGFGLFAVHGHKGGKGRTGVGLVDQNDVLKRGGAPRTSKKYRGESTEDVTSGRKERRNWL